MAIQVTMPRLSDTMQQGTIVKWNVKEGQKVKTGDVIADIETDKATMELQTFDDGTVAKLIVAQGQTVPVGTLMMLLASAGEDIGAVAASAKGGATAAPVAAKAQAVGAEAVSGRSGSSIAVMEPPHANTHGDAGDRVFASPLARKIADEAGLDLSRVQGSGPAGRIVRKDVEEAIAGGTARGTSTRPQATTATQQTVRTFTAPLPAAASTLTARRIPVSNMRRIIAQRLSESKATVPHYQVTFDVDMQPLMALRSQLNEQLAQQGVKLSVNDFLVRACALARARRVQSLATRPRGAERGAG